MVTTAGWLYLGAGTLLFFFWAYGIVSFALDVKNVYVPAVRGWRAASDEQESDRDPTEEPAPTEQLY